MKIEECRSQPGPQINSGIRESRHVDPSAKSISVHITMRSFITNPEHRLIVNGFKSHTKFHHS